MHKMTTLFVHALLSGDQFEAWKIVQMYQQHKNSSSDFYEDLITQSMREIGHLWETNQITVAEEHLATSTCNFILAYHHSKRTSNIRYMTERPKAMFLCIEEEQHDIGLKLTSHLFEQSGWSTKLYGANLPLDALLDAAHEWKPDIIGLSVSIPYHLVNLKKYVSQLENIEHQPTVLVGGRLVEQYDLSPHCSDKTLLIKGIKQLEEWLLNNSAGVKVNVQH
ncbi:B12-binding domain-containing protein [Alkalihalophilus sp. As8PL]|uniref:B12-binding domain-containing protein n=1 Tax=Alkalihalophilus sp. As8PL TaxID=3237103 RepID=A0AB39BSG4_9BACI